MSEMRSFIIILAIIVKTGGLRITGLVDKPHVCSRDLESTGLNGQVIEVNFALGDYCNARLGVMLKMAPPVALPELGFDTSVAWYNPATNTTEVCKVTAPLCMRTWLNVLIGTKKSPTDNRMTGCISLHGVRENKLLVTLLAIATDNMCARVPRIEVRVGKAVVRKTLQSSVCRFGSEKDGACVVSGFTGQLHPRPEVVNAVNSQDEKEVFYVWMANIPDSYDAQGLCVGEQWTGISAETISGIGAVGEKGTGNWQAFIKSLSDSGAKNCTVMDFGFTPKKRPTVTYVGRGKMNGVEFDRVYGGWGSGMKQAAGQVYSSGIELENWGKPVEDIICKQGSPVMMKIRCTVAGIREPIEKCSVKCLYTTAGAECVVSSASLMALEAGSCTVISGGSRDAVVQCPTGAENDVYCNGFRLEIDREGVERAACLGYYMGLLGPIGDPGAAFASSLCKGGTHSILFLALICFTIGGALVIPGLLKLFFVIWGTVCYWVSMTKYNANYKRIIKRLKDKWEGKDSERECPMCGKKTGSKAEMAAHVRFCPDGKCPYCRKQAERHDGGIESCGERGKKLEEWRKASVDLEKPVRWTGPQISSLVVGGVLYPLWVTIIIVLLIAWGATGQEMSREDYQRIATSQTGDVEPREISGASITPGKKGVLNIDVENGKAFMQFACAKGINTILKRHAKTPKGVVPILVGIGPLIECIDREDDGRWCDVDVASGAAFDCTGDCKDWAAEEARRGLNCITEKQWEFQTGWGCNPGACWSVNQGCFAGAAGMVNFRCDKVLYKALGIETGRVVCYSIGPKTACAVIISGECYSTELGSVCLAATEGNYKPDVTYMQTGGYEGLTTILEGVCNTNCKFGDIGDVRKNGNDEIVCPDFALSMERQCKLAHEPTFVFNGQLTSGRKRYDSIVNSFTRFNFTEKATIDSKTCGYQVGKAEGQLLSFTIPQSVLDEAINCTHSVEIKGIQGTWGSSQGVMVTCGITLAGCDVEGTIVSVCGKSSCFGKKAASLISGLNVVVVGGQGGSSWTKFHCCVGELCSEKGLPADDPTNFTPTSDQSSNSSTINDNSNDCAFVCWLEKGWDWVVGFFENGWWIFVLVAIAALIVLMMVRRCMNGRKSVWEGMTPSERKEISKKLFEKMA
ncbi:glycoprotein [Wenling yellow goosefish hantavirus]|uniref:Glycoprotein n=1 Tax=Wenling yellow goosefish hantavirus TaxID=2116436 RepID=A0A2P1GNW1_9VIRU|nr:glycoprotein [Wenling yellow goosefish hantavirus]